MLSVSLCFCAFWRPSLRPAAHRLDALEEFLGGWGAGVVAEEEAELLLCFVQESGFRVENAENEMRAGVGAFSLLQHSRRRAIEDLKLRLWCR